MLLLPLSEEVREALKQGILFNFGTKMWYFGNYLMKIV